MKQNKQIQKKIIIDNHELLYTIRKSKRARNLRLEVRDNSMITIIVPYGVSESQVLSFLKDKKSWILKCLQKFSKKKRLPLKGTREEYLIYKKVAYDIIAKKVEYWNLQYNFNYKKITIKNLKTQWGSCSSKGNLNFNYKMIFLTEEQIDYIVVHELCHLGQMNHSARFWALVAQTTPNYKEICKDIKGLCFD